MYQASEKRYETMKYRRCGRSGLMLPALSLGLWHNFGSAENYENMKQMCFTAFDLGITHFDLAVERGQSLPQMALAWNLKDQDVTSVIIGASKPEQITENCKMLESEPFTEKQLQRIEEICNQ